MAVVTTNLGVITAYGDAVAAGYTGTKAQWQALMANYATVGQQAAQDAQTASQAAQTATTKAGEASQSATAAAASAASITTPDATLTQAGVAADAKATGDEISDLKEDLSHKANVDGYYADLVSGGSTQLLSDMVETDTTPYNYRTAGGSLEIGDREKLKKIVGGSLVVNQLCPSDIATQTINGITFTNNGDGTWTVNGTATVTTALEITRDDSYPNGRKLYMSSGYAGVIASIAAYNGVTVDTTGSGFIYTTDSTLHKRFAIRVNSGTTVSNVVIRPQLFDLTAMFGTTIADYVYGLETATAGAGVAWLKNHFPKIFDSGYIPYNAGTLEHVGGLSAHKMTGFNQWDEEWENGRFNVSTGEKSSGNGLASKNKIRVLPNTTYYVTRGSGYGSTLVLFYYDASENLISYEVKYSLTTPFTTPNDACYMNINLQTSSAVTAYNHDICINLHWDGERDGEYEPYEEHSYPLDSTVELRGLFKLDANNKLYADGDTYEYTGKVTRNTILRAYQSGDESLTNAITDGTNTVVYSANASTEQADPYQHLQQCDPYGTEEFVSTGIVPVGHETRYPENLRAKIEGLPWNFASLIAPTEATFTATRNYTTGSLFIVDNVLYKATSNIANGGTITPNTNCTATTLAEIISALA